MGRSVVVPAAQLNEVGYFTGPTGGSNQIVVNAIDNQGVFSADFLMTINVSGAVDLPPLINGQATVNSTRYQSFDFTSLIRASDPDGTVASYKFSDATPGAGYLTLDGQQISGTSITVSAADLGKVGYFTGPNAGSNQIAIDAIDNQGVSSTDFLMTINVAGVVNQKPVISGATTTIQTAATYVDLSSFIQATDPDGSVASYKVSYSGTDDGYLTLDLNAVRGTPIEVPATQLGRIGFVTGLSVGATEVITIDAIDNQGLSSSDFNLAITVAAANPPAYDSPPTPATLAALSNDTYQTTPGGADLFAPIAYVTDRSSGFEAVAYQNGNQIVIAFRGTYRGDNAALVKNILADASFLTDSATLPLASEVEDAAKFVAQIHSDYPDAQLTLTGHSLGGAIAQLVGQTSGIASTAFDAPGAGDLFTKLASELQWAPIVSSSAQTRNYRLYGDQVSLVGTPIGEQFTEYNSTLEPNAVFVNTESALGVPPERILSYAIQSHVDIGQIEEDLRSGLFPISDPGPNYVSQLANYVINHPVEVALLSGAALNVQFLFNVAAGGDYSIDPGSGSDFVFSLDASSPRLSSIELPILGGVQAYNVTVESGGLWSEFQKYWPGQYYDLGAVDGIEIIPFDSSNQPVSLSGAFLFKRALMARERFRRISQKPQRLSGLVRIFLDWAVTTISCAETAAS